jgi:hypothetical protein
MGQHVLQSGEYSVALLMWWYVLKRDRLRSTYWKPQLWGSASTKALAVVSYLNIVAGYDRYGYKYHRNPKGPGEVHQVTAALLQLTFLLLC